MALGNLSPKDEENFSVLKNNLQNPADITEAVPPDPTCLLYTSPRPRD